MSLAITEEFFQQHLFLEDDEPCEQQPSGNGSSMKFTSIHEALPNTPQKSKHSICRNNANKIGRANELLKLRLLFIKLEQNLVISLLRIQQLYQNKVRVVIGQLYSS